MKKIPAFVFFLLLTGHVYAQYQPSTEVDIEHYSFYIEVNDSTDNIRGVAQIDMRSKKDVNSFDLDLIDTIEKNAGMVVDAVTLSRNALQFNHRNDKLTVTLPASIKANSTFKIQVNYHGIPADGLIISKNKFNERTFFADNWPNRGRNWLPIVDHPADKATVEWMIVAPAHYTAVANGARLEESYLNAKQKITRYRESAPIATKVMVIGVARFAMEQSGFVANTPIESWVYPQNRKDGFSDYNFAVPIFEYFNQEIGPYAYEKLANVQSKTTFGGLENASAIFYAESTVDGKRSHESLVAHEIAHQWFGDAVTEKEWKDVWLSEGFATYFSILYLEHAYGEKRRREEMNKDRSVVIGFEQTANIPVIQPVGRDLLEILNTNSYQKGSWVLHMLRRTMGNDAFWKGIRSYYQKYKNANASTDDFRKEMEAACGQDLKTFFDQWLSRPGHPVLAHSWTYDEKKKELRLTIEQKKSPAYTFPLEILITTASGTEKIEKLEVTGAKREFTIKMTEKPAKIELDPHVDLLYEAFSKN